MSIIQKMVRYKVKTDQLEAVRSAVVEFVESVRRNEPQTYYQAYETSDPGSFVHFMGFIDSDAEREHREAPYTARFVDVLYPKCEEQPAFTDLRTVTVRK